VGRGSARAGDRALRLEIATARRRELYGGRLCIQPRAAGDAVLVKTEVRRRELYGGSGFGSSDAALRRPDN
jgi:hypothetical protein